MYTKWTSHLPKERQSEFEALISSSRLVLKRLKEMLNDEVKSCERVQLDKEYDVAWPYKQADSIGELRAYRKAIKLLDNAINEE